MGKLSSILLGTVSGVAAALFLTSDKGKQVRSQAQEFLEDLKEDPEYAKEQVCEKLTDVKEQTKEFVLKTKEQIESGEITLDTVLDKAKYHAQQATEASKETLNHFKSQLEEKVVVEEKENGEKIIANMDNRLKALQNKIAKNYKGSKPRILMYTTFGSTSGKNTTFDDMVRLINGINVISEAGINKYQDISKEKIIELNPDIIIVPIAKKYDNVAKVSKLFFEDPSLKNVKAVKNKKVYFVQYKDISATSQYMIDNIENLAKIVYQFKE